MAKKKRFKKPVKMIPDKKNKTYVVDSDGELHTLVRAENKTEAAFKAAKKNVMIYQQIKETYGRFNKSLAKRWFDRVSHDKLKRIKN